MTIDMTKRKTYIGDVFSALLDRGWAIQETVDFCNRLSTVDAVSVVRCKECEYFENEECVNPYIWMSDGAHLWPDEDFYCANGERRDTDA